MSRVQVIHLSLPVILSVLFLVGCGTVATSSLTEAPATTSPPEPPVVTATSLPPTLPPPSETPLPSTQPAPDPRSATLAPGEVLAGSAEDVVGVWRGDFGWVTKEGYLILRLDGTYTISPQADGSQGNSGSYAFEGSEIHLDDFLCGKGAYEVRLSKGDNDAAALRFIVIQDDCPARVERLLNKGLPWLFQSEPPA